MPCAASPARYASLPDSNALFVANVAFCPAPKAASLDTEPPALSLGCTSSYLSLEAGNLFPLVQIAAQHCKGEAVSC